MKWLTRTIGSALGLIVTLVLGLWLAGMRPGHGHVVMETEIARPAPQVFRWITQEDLLKKWIGGLTEIERVAPGENGREIGARYRITVVLGQERTPMGMKITRLEPDRDLEILVWSEGDPKNGFNETAEYTLREHEGKTNLRFEVQTSYYGFTPRLFEPVITWSAKHKLEEDLRRLKQLVEAEPVEKPAPTG